MPELAWLTAADVVTTAEWGVCGDDVLTVLCDVILCLTDCDVDELVECDIVIEWFDPPPYADFSVLACTELWCDVEWCCVIVVSCVWSRSFCESSVSRTWTSRRAISELFVEWWDVIIVAVSIVDGFSMSCRLAPDGGGIACGCGTGPYGYGYGNGYPAVAYGCV